MSQPSLNSSFFVGLLLGAVLYWLYNRQMGGGAS